MGPDALVTGRIAGARRFLDGFEKTVPVAAALWLRRSDEDDWELAVVSDHFNDGASADDYGLVLRAAGGVNPNDLDPFRVRLLGLGDPLGRAAVEFYRTRPAKTPVYVRRGTIGDIGVEEAYLLRGPTGDYAMPSGRETLNQIIDGEADYFRQNERSPAKMRIPVLMAYDLAKCGRNEIGDLSGKVFMDGITVFEKEGFHGMKVEIVRDRNAKLEFE